MKWVGKLEKKQAFTLIELMVALTIILIIVGLVGPAVQKAQLSGKLTESAFRAKEIVTAIMAKEQAGSRFDGPAWPQSGDDNAISSTAYLASLVEEGYLEVNYDFFAAPGMKAAKNKAEFLSGGSRHNAWCLMLDVNDSTPGNFPVVFTKNIELSGTSITVAEDRVPFGNKGVAYATRNGNGESLERAEVAEIDHIFFPENTKAEKVKVLMP